MIERQPLDPEAAALDERAQRAPACSGALLPTAPNACRAGSRSAATCSSSQPPGFSTRAISRIADCSTVVGQHLEHVERRHQIEGAARERECR